MWIELLEQVELMIFVSRVNAHQKIPTMDIALTRPGK